MAEILRLGKIRFTVTKNACVFCLETEVATDLGHVTQEKTQQLATDHSEERKCLSFVHLGAHSCDRFH